MLQSKLPLDTMVLRVADMLRKWLIGMPYAELDKKLASDMNEVN
jgi:hypothetical protein